MKQITVKVRTDIGDPGRHPKYGALVPGASISIDEADFGAGLFERPAPDHLSPHELADRTRGEELKCSVGTFEYVPPAPAPERAAKKTAVPEVINA